MNQIGASQNNYNEPQGVGVASLNLLYEVVYWNDNMRSITGLSEAEVKGKHIEDILPGFKSPLMRRRMDNCVRNGVVEFISGVLNSRLFIRPGSDSEALKDFMLTLAPLRIEEEESVGMILILEVTGQGQREKTDEAQSVSCPYEALDTAQLVEDLIHRHHNPALLSSVLALLTTATGNLVPMLVELLEKSDADLKIYVLQTLGERGDNEAIPAIIKSLDDPDPNVKYHAIEALGKLKAVECVNQLVSIAFSDDYFLSSAAIMALALMGDAMVYPSLRLLWKNEMLTDAMISLASACGTVEAVTDLCTVINQNPLYTAEAAQALAKILSGHRLPLTATPHEKLISKLIDATGAQNLLRVAEQAPEDKLPALLRILALLDYPSVDKFLIRVIGNPQVKEVVIEGLVKKGDRLMPALAQLIESGDESERSAAIITLGRIGNSAALPYLVKALNDEPQLAILAAGALAKIGDRAAFEPLIANLGHPDPLVRRAAISALNSIGHPQMEAVIFRLLDDPDPLVRESAIKIAGYFGYPSCAPKVVSALYDSDNLVLAAAIEALPFFDLENAEKLLTGLFHTSNARIRSQIAKSAAFLEPEMALPILRLALSDLDPWVRTFALRSVSRQGLKEFHPILKEILEGDHPPFLYAAAMEAVGALQLVEFMPLLKQYAQSSNLDLAGAAINALADLGMEEALNHLLEMLPGVDAELKKYLIQVLRHFNHNAVVDQLVVLASASHDEALRQACIETLSILDTPHAYLGLLKLIRIPACQTGTIEALIAKKKHYPELIWQFGQMSVENRLLLVSLLQHLPLAMFRDILVRYASDEDFRVRNHYHMLLTELDLLMALEDSVTGNKTGHREN
ncbi:MAG: HEAT repeat domain-containing protein [Bacteroidales bacterium]